MSGIKGMTWKNRKRKEDRTPTLIWVPKGAAAKKNKHSLTWGQLIDYSVNHMDDVARLFKEKEDAENRSK